MNLLKKIELGLIQCNEPVAPAGDSPAPAAPGGGGGGGEESPSTPDTPSAMWEELATDTEGSEDVIEEVVEAPAATAPAPAQPTPPPAPVAPAQQPAVPETPQAAQPPQQQPAPSPVPAQAQQEQQMDYQQVLQRTHAELEQRYQLSEEDAQRLHTEPEKVLPKLAAIMVADTVQSTMAQMAKVLPMMIAQVQQRTKTYEEGESAFYKEWPDLKGKDEVVLRIGRAYRAMYPQASREQFIREVGAQAAMALRLPIDPTTGKIVQPQVQQQRPAYTPPRAAAAAPRTTPGNEFEQLAEEFLNDDF